MNSVRSVKEKIVNEIHKTSRKNFRRRKMVVKGIGDLLQADLVDMQEFKTSNKNFKYILFAIDVFSKVAYGEPLKSKSSEDVYVAMKKILQRCVKPAHLQTDKGKEFFNNKFKKLMQEYKINHYATQSEMKAMVVERFNRTIKNKMWKRFNLQGSHNWINILQELVKEYNNTIHSTINMRPIDVSKINEKQILKSVYNYPTVNKRVSKLKVGDYVRISKRRHMFSRGYLPMWTTELFKIRKVQYTIPHTYLLKDLNDENILGSFYLPQLQKTELRDEYLVEKVLKKKGNKYLVKWLGFDDSQNSWVKENQLL